MTQTDPTNDNRCLWNAQVAYDVMNDSEVGPQLAALMFLLQGNADGARVHLALLEPYASLERFYEVLGTLADMAHLELARREADMEE